jgi:hypothetical protein
VDGFDEEVEGMVSTPSLWLSTLHDWFWKEIQTHLTLSFAHFSGILVFQTYT